MPGRWRAATSSVGMVRKTDLESAVARGEGGKKLAEILAGRAFPHLHPDHRLGLALERMGAAHVNVLPVVSRANLGQLIGIVTLDDVLRAYGVAKPAAKRNSPMESPEAPSSGPGPSFLGTFALVFLAIGALFAIDTFLAKVEQSEMATQAARLFREGQLLAQEGRDAESIARLRAALAISRDNPAYQLALADVLLRANKLADAEALLANMLQNDATDGGANLLMARALARQGKPEAAEFYYHMAIYGQWPQDARREPRPGALRADRSPGEAGQ